ncbi:uncharacterized protein LOC122757395 [Drosophila mojavensis]|uniref:uncharacterized protein LOC122757395 n=1 Tax=Drosophila mojavensis TaxID=7230 RepID=UPI001CD083E3|nr:uncharacterized protein LOC122757395 [Drosophila mojavensis]
MQNGTFKIIHVFDISEHEKIFGTFEETLNNISNSHQMYPQLNYELNSVRNDLRRLKHSIRVARAINALGTAWKWLAGTPDHSDHEVLITKINEQLENNNKQVVINRVLQDRINEITQTSNNIMKIVKDHSNIQEEKITFFKYKLQIFKDDLTNLIHAIDWAKTNTINSIILSESEVKIIEQILEREKIMFLNAEELLEVSQIKIASNGKNILYIINIPLISNEVCTTMLIKPIKRKNYINEIKFENIVKCENSIYAIRDSCESHNEKTICNKNKLVDLRSDTCTLPLLKSQPPNCRAINNQHVPNHEQLFVGTILLNDAQVFYIATEDVRI